MIIVITIIIMHLAGSPGSYFAYLKDCLVHETTPRQVLEENLAMFHPELSFWDIAVNMTEIEDEPGLPFRINRH